MPEGKITINELKELSQTFIRLKFEQYRRYFIKNTPLNHRFMIILGERGVGKTTTVIQYLVDAAQGDITSDQILYVQADHFLMKNRSLYEIADEFYKLGGKLIAFDEIHKYTNWSHELKSIYDTFKDLKIIVSGSALEIHKNAHELERCAAIYRMVGLSFREFIELKYGLELAPLSLDILIADHTRFCEPNFI